MPTLRRLALAGLLAGLAGCSTLPDLAPGGDRTGPGDSSPSIWFGNHLVDGVLFPLLALALAYVARRVLLELGQPLAVFRLAIPVLLSLAVIRLSVPLRVDIGSGRNWDEAHG